MVRPALTRVGFIVGSVALIIVVILAIPFTGAYARIVSIDVNSAKMREEMRVFGVSVWKHVYDTELSTMQAKYSAPVVPPQWKTVSVFYGISDQSQHYDIHGADTSFVILANMLEDPAYDDAEREEIIEGFLKVLRESNSAHQAMKFVERRDAEKWQRDNRESE